MKNSTKTATLSLVAFLSCASSAYAIEAPKQIQPPVLKFDEGSHCKINLVDPHPKCEESQKVIDTLRTIFEAYGRHDFKTVAEYMTDDCTGFAENHKFLCGKKATLEYVEKNVAQITSDTDSPLLAFTIERPYAEVNGDTATVTFLAYKEFGGKHPHTVMSHSTDIFVKRDGRWLKSHFRNCWKEVSSNLKASHIGPIDTESKSEEAKVTNN